MLQRWRKIIRMEASATPMETTCGGAWRGAYARYIKNGRDAAAAIDPNEMYRQNATTATKIASAAKTAGTEIIRNPPAAVATPFPPRNLSHTGNRWPAMAASAATIIQSTREGLNGLREMESRMKCAGSQTAR